MLRPSAEKLANVARAEAAFKPAQAPPQPLNEYAREKKIFDDNRERLKSERLIREANRRTHSG
jgi:hypothetical protein